MSKNYTTIRQMTSHLTKSIQCFQDITKDLYCQQTTTTGKTRNTNKTSLDSNSMVECSTNPIVNMDFLDDNVEIESDEIMDDNSNSFGNNVNIQDNVLCYSNTVYHQTKLLQILDNANTPHYLYSQVLEWVIKAQNQKIDFNEMKKTRKGNIHQIERMLPWLKSTKPKTVTTQIDTDVGKEPIEVTVFDFKTQLLSLLQDETLFGNINNLDIDPDNPFGPYKSPDNVLSAVNSWKHYARAYSNMINDPENEFLVPIIFSSDETKVSNQGKSYSWPIMFTTSILNQETRNKPSAWHLLGFIPDFKLTTSASEEKEFGKHLKSRRLHQALKVILKSFVDFKKRT